MTYDPKILNASPEEKAAAFEWLRKRALHGGKNWRMAAVAFEEWSRLSNRPGALRPEVTNISPEVVRVGDLPIRVIENPAFRWDQALIVSGGKVYAYNVTTGQTKVVSERLPDGRWTHES